MNEPLRAVPKDDELKSMFQALLDASCRIGSVLRIMGNEACCEEDSSAIDVLIDAGQDAQIVTTNLAQIIPEKLGINISDFNEDDSLDSFQAAYKYARENWKA